MFGLATFADGPIASTPLNHRRFVDSAGAARFVLQARGVGNAYASGIGAATFTLQVRGGITRVVSTQGAASLQVMSRSSAVNIASGVGSAGVRSTAKAWAAELNFPSYPPEFGRMVQIGRRFYRWEQTLGRWRPRPPV